MNNKKPLHAYEQSMLLSALLFDNSNIDDILQFFPDEQRERMSFAKNKFLNLQKNERLTKIVLELRRLILMDDNPINWIHQSWIDDALALEPPYMREIVLSSIRSPSKETNAPRRKITSTFILSSFLRQLIKNPQKRAIFDPVLMRLQSLKNEPQQEVFSVIGTQSINALASTLDANRLKRYLLKRGFTMELGIFNLEANPFKNDLSVRSFFIKELIRFPSKSNIDGMVFAGLVVVAMYLSVFKYQWQRTIVLVLDKKIGSLLENIIERSKSLTIDRNHHALLSGLLLLSFEHEKEK